ncbi:hypothetical protein B0H19DRAFT_1243447 [Mycena capillaripes]|nr:hypothetical protein B0H19DRAFT_1243447 [Mycena capillaripes]
MRLHLWHESCNGKSKKDNVFHKMPSHLTGCSAAPNATEMGNRREMLPCCVTRNRGATAQSCARGPASPPHGFGSESGPTNKGLHMGWEHHNKHVVEGDVLAFHALGMCGEGASGSGKGVSAPSAFNAEWSQKKITRGRVTTRTPSRAASSRSAHSRRVGEGARDSGEGARAVPNAEWRQKKKRAHHDEDVVEGNVPAFRALRTCGGGCAGQWGRWAHHDDDIVKGSVPAFRALKTCGGGALSTPNAEWGQKKKIAREGKSRRERCLGQYSRLPHAQNVRGRVWGKVGKMRTRCTKPGECPVVPKKELTPGTLIIVLLLIFLYTRFLGIGGKGGRWCKFRRECSGTGWESGLHPCEAWTVTVVSNTAAVSLLQPARNQPTKPP